MHKVLNKKFILSFVFYAISLLLAIYVIWSFTYCADIISQAKEAGQLAASGNEFDIISFYMGNCCQYFIYALLLAAAGLLMQRGQQPHNNAEPERNMESAPKNNKNDDELDEWFSE